MFAQQQQQHQAALAALSSRGGLSESVNGSPMAAVGSNSPFTAAATDSPASKIGRMRIDKTPIRDQDDQFSLAVGAWPKLLSEAFTCCLGNSSMECMCLLPASH
jgi:hypothetical protein